MEHVCFLNNQQDNQGRVHSKRHGTCRYRNNYSTRNHQEALNCLCTRTTSYLNDQISRMVRTSVTSHITSKHQKTKWTVHSMWQPRFNWTSRTMSLYLFGGTDQINTRGWNHINFSPVVPWSVQYELEGTLQMFLLWLSKSTIQGNVYVPLWHTPTTKSPWLNHSDL